MVTLNELKVNYSSISQIPYFELIKTKEWFDHREPILKRDNFECKECGKTSTMPHYDPEVHKTFHLWFIDKTRSEKIGIDIDLEIPDIKVADRQYSLHVHHKLYILNRLPWEYNAEDLVTLCNWCHWDFHETNIVPVYRILNESLVQLNYTPCSRCNGAGWFPQYQHVENGVCFRCKGSRYEQLIPPNS